MTLHFSPAKQKQCCLCYVGGTQPSWAGNCGSPVNPGHGIEKEEPYAPQLHGFHNKITNAPAYRQLLSLYRCVLCDFEPRDSVREATFWVLVLLYFAEASSSPIRASNLSSLLGDFGNQGLEEAP
jgi:hypothetical protein